MDPRPTHERGPRTLQRDLGEDGEDQARAARPPPPCSAPAREWSSTSNRAVTSNSLTVSTHPPVPAAPGSGGARSSACHASSIRSKRPHRPGLKLVSPWLSAAVRMAVHQPLCLDRSPGDNTARSTQRVPPAGPRPGVVRSDPGALGITRVRSASRPPEPGESQGALGVHGDDHSVGPPVGAPCRERGEQLSRRTRPRRASREHPWREPGPSESIQLPAQQRADRTGRGHQEHDQLSRGGRTAVPSGAVRRARS